MNLKTIAVVGIGLIVLACAAYYLAGVVSPSAPTTKTFTLVVADKKLVKGEPTLTAHVGDTVVISITADEEEEFHLHGYDRSVDLHPGEEASLTLVAEASGRFEFELEKSKVELGALEVQP